jgi:hypothetical protein
MHIDYLHDKFVNIYGCSSYGKGMEIILGLPYDGTIIYIKHCLCFFTA